MENTERDELFEGTEEFMDFESADDGIENENDAFEKLIEEGISTMSEDKGTDESNFMDERLREAKKALPEWSLEPPFSFLK